MQTTILFGFTLVVGLSGCPSDDVDNADAGPDTAASPTMEDSAGDSWYGPCPCDGETCVSVGDGGACAVPCTEPNNSCPDGGTCVAQLQAGPPTHCALACDPAAPTCPSGMDCIDLEDDPGVVADGICYWPSDG